MKKRITFAFISLLLMLYIAVPCFASSTLLVDKAGVLSGTEAVEVLLALEDASTKHGASFVIVTVYGTDNKSMMEYADDFFDYNDYGESGILLLIDMKDGDYWISTSGEFDSYSINYEALNVIEKDILGYLKNEDFYGAFTVFAEDCSDIYNLRDTSEEPFNWFTSVLVALGVGVVAASIVTGVMKKTA